MSASPHEQPPAAASSARAPSASERSETPLQDCRLEGRRLPERQLAQLPLGSVLRRSVTPRGEQAPRGGGKPSHAALSLQHYFKTRDARGITTAASPPSRGWPRGSSPFGCVEKISLCFSALARIKYHSTAVFQACVTQISHPAFQSWMFPNGFTAGRLHRAILGLPMDDSQTDGSEVILSPFAADYICLGVFTVQTPPFI